MPTRRELLDEDAAWARAVTISAMDGEAAAISFLQKWHARRRELLNLPPRAAEDTETDDAGEDDAEDDFDE